MSLLDPAILGNGLSQLVDQPHGVRPEFLAERDLVRNKLAGALEAVGPAITAARRQGELSALIPKLVLHALVPPSPRPPGPPRRRARR